MKDGLRFVDCDMHIMEPVDLFDRYLDPRFKDRVTSVVGADGKPRRGTMRRANVGTRASGMSDNLSHSSHSEDLRERA